jgi:pantetheine-phosphate adenylyltransferase
VTNGHIDIVERSLRFIDRIVISVTNNPMKRHLFTQQERVAMLEEVFAGRHNVAVEHFHGLLVDELERKGIYLVIRGLRAVSDFDYEFQMVLTNRTLLPRIETIFLMPREEYLYMSSSLVKEIAHMNGPVERFVPPAVARELRKKFA